MERGEGRGVSFFLSFFLRPLDGENNGKTLSLSSLTPFAHLPRVHVEHHQLPAPVLALARRAPLDAAGPPRGRVARGRDVAELDGRRHRAGLRFLSFFDVFFFQRGNPPRELLPLF